jgi:hypothetical protein
VQDHALGEPRNHRAGRGDPHRAGDPLVEAAQHLGVGLVDRIRVHPIEPGEGRDGLLVAARGDPPVEVDDRGILRADAVGEGGQPDVHDPDLLGQAQRLGVGGG